MPLAASSEILPPLPFMWHGLNFNPKDSGRDRKVTKMRNPYSVLFLPFSSCTELELTLEIHLGKL